MIFFWLANSEYGFLSNWHMDTFQTISGTYTSGEQSIMHQKALTFGDTAMADKIMRETDLGEIKGMGKDVKPYDEDTWRVVRERAGIRASRARFSQNAELLKQLLDTGHEVLAEASPYDSVWGIGMSADKEKSKDMRRWPKYGNLQGRILMHVRRELRQWQA